MCTRSADTVARLGGDEFAILLEGITDPADVERIAGTIIDSFKEPLPLDGNDIFVAASIGVAFSQDGDDTEQLLRNADIAMYSAKATGKGRYVVFQPRMQEQLRERLRLVEDIDRALERKEFFLEFQPVVDLKTRELLGVEALVRWQHPEQGLVMPGNSSRSPRNRARSSQLGTLGAGRGLLARPRLAGLDRCRRRAAGCRQRLRPPSAACGSGRRCAAVLSKSRASSRRIW